MAVELWVWGGFLGLIISLLLVDLLIFHRRAHEVALKEALGWTAVWIAVAVAFGAGVWLWLGPGPGLEFYTGYVIEKSLSVDNLFVFLLIFSYFSVPKRDEHKILFWGILGALGFRAIFIFGGAALIERFHWVLYIFGAVLVIAAVRMVIRKEETVHPERNPILRLVRRLIPITFDYWKDNFFVRHKGKLFATPLFVVLIVVETTDIIFALDSVPAIFAITLDPFIIYTSNAFAILGLRALFFAVEHVLQRLRYLHYGLAALLGFVAVKIFISDFVKIPIEYALGITGLILLVATVASLAVPETPRAVKPPIKLPESVDPLGPQPLPSRKRARKASNPEPAEPARKSP